MLFSAVLLLIALTACTNEPSNADSRHTSQPTATDVPRISQSLDNGAAIYARYCAECHGLDGEGESPDSLTSGDLAPPHDATGHTWHHADDLLIEIIRDGGISKRMPAFSEQLSAAQIELVIAHIKTFWTDEQRAYQAEVTEALRNQ